MKKLFGVLLAVLTIYAIYIDLTIGTLPSATQQVDAQVSTMTISKPKTVMPSFDAEVMPGDTVISIVEHQIKKTLPVPITELIEDFQKLNPGKTPEKIQIGTTYHFPDYSN